MLSLLVGCEVRGQGTCQLFGGPSQCLSRITWIQDRQEGEFGPSWNVGSYLGLDEGVVGSGLGLWKQMPCGVLAEGRTSHSQGPELWDDSLFLP